jgi:hypothetical protein
MYPNPFGRGETLCLVIIALACLYVVVRVLAWIVAQ